MVEAAIAQAQKAKQAQLRAKLKESGLPVQEYDPYSTNSREAGPGGLRRAI